MIVRSVTETQRVWRVWIYEILDKDEEMPDVTELSLRHL